MDVSYLFSAEAKESVKDKFGKNEFTLRNRGNSMKKLCKENKIPTADFKVCNKKSEVLNFLNN